MNFLPSKAATVSLLLSLLAALGCSDVGNPPSNCPRVDGKWQFTCNNATLWFDSHQSGCKVTATMALQPVTFDFVGTISDTGELDMTYTEPGRPCDGAFKATLSAPDRMDGVLSTTNCGGSCSFQMQKQP